MSNVLYPDIVHQLAVSFVARCEKDCVSISDDAWPERLARIATECLNELKKNNQGLVSASVEQLFADIFEKVVHLAVLRQELPVAALVKGILGPSLEDQEEETLLGRFDVGGDNRRWIEEVEVYLVTPMALRLLDPAQRDERDTSKLRIPESWHQWEWSPRKISRIRVMSLESLRVESDRLSSVGAVPRVIALAPEVNSLEARAGKHYTLQMFEDAYILREPIQQAHSDQDFFVRFSCGENLHHVQHIEKFLALQF